MLALFFAPGHKIWSVFLSVKNGSESLDLNQIGYTLPISYQGNDENLKLVQSQNYGSIN